MFLHNSPAPPNLYCRAAFLSQNPGQTDVSTGDQAQTPPPLPQRAAQALTDTPSGEGSRPGLDTVTKLLFSPECFIWAE